MNITLENSIRNGSHAFRAFHLPRLSREKNPYLYCAKNITTSEQFISSLLQAYLSSQEETIFGNILEGLALKIADVVHGGWKSSAQGVDLEFRIKDEVGNTLMHYLVSIKSGPNWGNSSQIRQMKANFTTAKKILRQGDLSINIIAVNGCCYGVDNNPDKGEYLKLCGQRFWELISNDASIHSRIIESLPRVAESCSATFDVEHDAAVRRLSQEFERAYCNIDGDIDWAALINMVSSHR